MSEIISMCKRDGFPEVIINGNIQCVAEYLNRCIGLKKITDVVQRDEELFYIFENGHELPLFCFCCDYPLVSKDLARSKEEVVGRRLESMSWEMVSVEDSEEAIEFYLELSTQGNEESLLQVSTSLKSAQELIHPTNCGYAPRPSLVKKPRKHRSRGRRKKRK